ncbi:MAG TPA: signal recognition particle protein [Thermodesulfobacteriota bacterium]|nr:signal recognition particle protein [Thermodesulfobacteriota bacterium]
MFDNLSEKLGLVFKKLKGHGKLSEENIKEVLREIRLALLEADVNFRVVKDFIEILRKRVVGQEVLESFTPAQQVIKIVHQELIQLLGGEKTDLNLTGPIPVSLMFVGLQGSGKTTTVGKLSRLLFQKNRRPFLVPVDIYRPAAIEQLRQIGESLKLPVYLPQKGEKPIEICKKALDKARESNCDTLLIDTAGRWHIDEPLMNELQEIKLSIKPQEILLLADAMTGQEAVNVALKFDEFLDLTGVILTKMDGDARGGAALSIKTVTKKPIKFVGMGEKMEDLEVFYPDRMASRILGMGDVLSLIEKAESALDERKTREMEKKLHKGVFTLEDFLEQLQQIKKMGSLEQLLGMIPGFSPKALKGVNVDQKELVKIEAIINSMTKEERRKHHIIDASRRRRIARGSGTEVKDVNQLLKKYIMASKMIKKFKNFGMKDLPKGMIPGL